MAGLGSVAAGTERIVWEQVLERPFRGNFHRLLLLLHEKLSWGVSMFSLLWVTFAVCG